jgi:hypothetical protein
MKRMLDKQIRRVNRRRHIAISLPSERPGCEWLYCFGCKKGMWHKNGVCDGAAKHKLYSARCPRIGVCKVVIKALDERLLAQLLRNHEGRAHQRPIIQLRCGAPGCKFVTDKTTQRGSRKQLTYHISVKH